MSDEKIDNTQEQNPALETSPMPEADTKKKVRSPWGFEEDELKAVEESMRPREVEGGEEDFDGRKIAQRFNSYMFHGMAIGAVVGFLLGGPVIGSTTQGMGVWMLVGLVVGVFFERKPKDKEKK
jgi:F0F1-type ATP synthase assembly protein I